MADQPTTPSGSRWEPRPDETPPDGAPADENAVPEAPTAYPGETAVDPGIDVAADERRAQLRRRAGLAGAAAAVALGAGLAGFVVGHATAGEDRSGFTPAGFSGQPGTGQPGSGQLGEGQQGPPAFGHHDDDGHDRDHAGTGASGNPT